MVIELDARMRMASWAEECVCCWWWLAYSLFVVITPRPSLVPLLSTFPTHGIDNDNRKRNPQASGWERRTEPLVGLSRIARANNTKHTHNLVLERQSVTPTVNKQRQSCEPGPGPSETTSMDTLDWWLTTQGDTDDGLDHQVPMSAVVWVCMAVGSLFWTCWL